MLVGAVWVGGGVGGAAGTTGGRDVDGAEAGEPDRLAPLVRVTAVCRGRGGVPDGAGTGDSRVGVGTTALEDTALEETALEDTALADAALLTGAEAGGESVVVVVSAQAPRNTAAQSITVTRTKGTTVLERGQMCTCDINSRFPRVMTKLSLR